MPNASLMEQIDDLLARRLSNDTRQELLEYRARAIQGRLAATDERYINALHYRMSDQPQGTRPTPQPRPYFSRLPSPADTPDSDFIKVLVIAGVVSVITGLIVLGADGVNFLETGVLITRPFHDVLTLIMPLPSDLQISYLGVAKIYRSIINTSAAAVFLFFIPVLCLILLTRIARSLASIGVGVLFIVGLGKFILSW